MLKLRADVNPEEMSIAEWMSTLPEEEQVKELNKWFYDAQARYGDGSIGIEQFLKNWRLWGRPEQQLPRHDNWDILLCLCGRGSGKTRLASEGVQEVAKNKNWHICLIGETSAEVRDVMIEGPSGLKATEKPDNRIHYEPSKRRVTWLGTGTWATTYSGDEPDQLRGASSNFAWVDEPAKFKYPDETMSNLQLALRAGESPHSLLTTTPRPIDLIKKLIKESQENSRIIVRRWSTFRNRANLAPSYLERIKKQYEGTRLGRQELYAEVLEDTEGALWTLRLIDKHRVTYTPHMSVIAVGVDPPASTSGTCGIVVMGLSGEDLYCLDDMSLTGVQPEEWGKQVVSAYHKWEADVVVPEKNMGGDMVLSTIRAIDPTVPMNPVWAARGKRTRAEPISTYTEKGAVHHIGAFSALEDELTTWCPDDGESPDRLDAYVWAATHLMEYTPYGAKSKQAKVLF